MPIDAFWSTGYIVYISSCNFEALSVIWGTEGKWHLHVCQGNRGSKKLNFEGNRRTKTVLGNREHHKTFIYYFWVQGNR